MQNITVPQSVVADEVLAEACCIVNDAITSVGAEIVEGCCGLLAEQEEVEEVDPLAAEKEIVAEGWPPYWSRAKFHTMFYVRGELQEDLYHAAIQRFQAAYHAVHGEYFVDPCTC